MRGHHAGDRGQPPSGRNPRMRTLVQRLKRLWNTPVEF